MFYLWILAVVAIFEAYRRIFSPSPVWWLRLGMTVGATVITSAASVMFTVVVLSFFSTTPADAYRVYDGDSIALLFMIVMAVLLWLSIQRMRNGIARLFVCTTEHSV